MHVINTMSLNFDNLFQSMYASSCACYYELHAVNILKLKTTEINDTIT